MEPNLFFPSPLVRATQKDAYYQSQLVDQLSALLRKLYGARFIHSYTTEIGAIADLLYHSLTTLRGARTLGEEYCDIVHLDADTVMLPGLAKRTGFVATVVLVPYILTKLLPRFRARVKGKLDRAIAQGEESLRRQQFKLNMVRTKAGSSSIDGGKRGAVAGPKVQVPITLKVQKYLRNNLDTFTSTENFLAVNLAVFYFSGAYYHLAKRMWGLRYIFTKHLAPHEQRAGYEVLGVLLAAQLLAQTYSHISAHLTPTPPDDVVTPAIPDMGAAVTGDNGGGVGGQGITLEDEKNMAYMQGELARKCTLCLSPMTDPTATSCGHVFCWGCIEEWCRNKPECPLCRQGALVQHLLPLRG